MSGLLDFVKTPEGQGLLSAVAGGLAGARRGAPVNSVGRGLLAGLAGYGNAQDRAAQAEESAFNKQYKTVQLARLQQEMASDKARSEFLQGLQGVPTAALSEGAQVGDVGPTKTNAARMDGKFPAGLQRIPSAALQAEIVLNGGKNLPEWMFKTGTPDMQVSGGYAYDKNNLPVGFIPQLSLSNDGKATQVTPDPVTGAPVVSAPRGALQTYGDYQNIAAGTTAAYDTMPITLPNGTTVLTTRKAVVDGSRAPGSQPAPRPSGNFSGPGYAGGSAANAASDQIAILTSERQKAIAAGRTRDVEALDRELSRLGLGSTPPQSSPVPGIQVQSEADKQGAIEKAKADAKASSAESLAAKNAQRASIQAQISVIDKAINHPGRATATGLSGVLHPSNYIPGTEARDFQVVLDQLGGAAFLQAFESLKGGGQITEVEGKKATDAIARLNRSQSDSEFETALRDLRDVMQGALSRLDGPGASGNFDPPPAGKGRVVQTGTYNGRKVVKYADGSVEYAD